MKKIIAECERCGGYWRVSSEHTDANLLEGICMICQDESDVERPLTFRAWDTDRDIEALDELPEDWIA